MRDQIRRLRTHPSVLAWLNGSDNPPPPDVEQMYLDILKELDWPNPYVSSATAKRTTVTGASGVKMTGPYDWVPPSYWLTGRLARRRLRLQHRDEPGRRRAAGREPAPDVAGRPSLADRRGVELPRGRRTVQDARGVHERARARATASRRASRTTRPRRS